MKIPTYERQNQWISDYITPLVLEGSIKKIVQNYKANRRESLRGKMESAGVFASLKKLESEGTSWDNIMSEMQDNIKYAGMETKMSEFISKNSLLTERRIEFDINRMNNRLLENMIGRPETMNQIYNSAKEILYSGIGRSQSNRKDNPSTAGA